MDPTNVDGAAYGIIIGWIAMGILLPALFIWGVLAVSALLGLPGVALFQRLRKRQEPERPGQEVDLDDLF
ncbi:hypothetical protein O1R50_14235 [Glycomyces luteolus]|uniref:Uncharacterized protein n=1 Tax=Glycomyces luteolus TaxID=2670330 RepID=A0A9X3PDW1_9ACTN|nr:hypothetical protein [Glycomyces luteolus]MDA1360784.1 hypothetical protein [Glycomyces luteolus]